MIVAVIAVRVMQMAADQIIDVVAVGHRFVAAAGTVAMAFLVLAAIVIGRAAGRVDAADGQLMFLDASDAHVVQMPVMQIIDMILVLNRHMAATGAMLMVVVGVVGSSQG